MLILLSDGTWTGTFNPDFPAGSPYITSVGGTDFQEESVVGEEVRGLALVRLHSSTVTHVGMVHHRWCGLEVVAGSRTRSPSRRIRPTRSPRKSSRRHIKLETPHPEHRESGVGNSSVAYCTNMTENCDCVPVVRWQIEEVLISTMCAVLQVSEGSCRHTPTCEALE